jgi:tetratricopeptide (TPR) repeat protein
MISGAIYAQNTNSPSKKSNFTLEGLVKDAETDLPVSKVNVEISGGDYTTTNLAGEFSISATIESELIIRSDQFKTVYYTIVNQENITVLVENVASDLRKNTSKRRQKKEQGLFMIYIDSAKQFQKIDAKKSIEYVTSALESVVGKNASNLENKIAFETLGDINLFWKQNDLAISNYKTSLSALMKENKKTKNSINLSLKLARAYRNNKNYQESITVYTDLLKQNLSTYQKVETYEGLGDTYKHINDPLKSIFNYQKGLDLAKEHTITPKITDLNSKIGEAYAQSGELEAADGFFTNSLKLAETENKTRAVKEKNKVADFYNQSQDYEKEIELREETLEELETINEYDSIGKDLNSPLTPQRQNYKIASAYVSQGNTEKAIPYLEKSIEEANKKEDIVVEKDATRKLSEIYKDKGEYDKAAESYQKYVALLDELYIKKEQEISQATRFRREIAIKQNRIISLESDRLLNESRYKLAFENEELTQKNIRVQKWVIGSLVIIALLLFYAVYIQFKSVKQQKYANNLLALKSLRTQMNPHFIFNALNSVNSFIASNDERAANNYLSEFSQLMRAVLENSEEDFISLEKEIELLKLYVKLEHFRFKDKFEYTITVDENINTQDFVIPPMLLQPYIENAVWHGLRYKKELGKLEIRFIQIDSETIKITIEDNGIGRKKSKELKTENQKKQRSKGMGNIQKRVSILNEMYKDKIDVFIEDASTVEEEIGTKVVLTLKKD